MNFYHEVHEFTAAIIENLKPNTLFMNHLTDTDYAI